MPLSTNMSPIVRKVRFLFWWLSILTGNSQSFIHRPKSACVAHKWFPDNHITGDTVHPITTAGLDNQRNLSHCISEVISELKKSSSWGPAVWKTQITGEKKRNRQSTSMPAQSSLKRLQQSVSIRHLCYRWNSVWVMFAVLHHTVSLTVKAMSQVTRWGKVHWALYIFNLVFFSFIKSTWIPTQPWEEICLPFQLSCRLLQFYRKRLPLPVL